MKMRGRVWIITAVFIFTFTASAFSEVSINKLNPYGLLTPSYGIVSEDDLNYDSERRKIGPYDPNDKLGSVHWQCFLKNEVKATFDSWRGPDGGAALNKVFDMCTLELDVYHDGEVQIYIDRRAHPIEFCRDFIHAWKRITKNETIVCLNGDGGGFEQDDSTGRYKSWTWNKFKTKRGCYSYFADDCKTSQREH